MILSELTNQITLLCKQTSVTLKYGTLRITTNRHKGYPYIMYVEFVFLYKKKASANSADITENA